MPTLPNHKLTAEEFAAQPFQWRRSELIAGEIHTAPPAFEDHGQITMRLSVILGRYVMDQRLGRSMQRKQASCSLAILTPCARPISPSSGGIACLRRDPHLAGSR